MQDDGMSCDPIQGQGQGDWASKVPKITLFKVYPIHQQMTTDS